MKKEYNSNLNVVFTIVVTIVLATGITSCKKFLDLKPDKSTVVPTTLADCQALLNDYNTMNALYPEEGEAAADNFYISESIFNAIQTNDRDNYIWAAQAQHPLLTWHYPYKTVYNSNLILRTLEKIDPSIGQNFNFIKGAALFYRSFAFYSIAQLYCKPYNTASAGSDLGIALRLNPDLDYTSVRGSVQQTYDQIIGDLKEAVDLLPPTSTIKSSPNKVAAFAMLARTYLAMEKYTEAGIYADSCLKRYGVLMNYANINPGSPTSTSPTIPRLNPEVIFQATCHESQVILRPRYSFIDPDLYKSYDNNDKRKSVFFSIDPNNQTQSFKGSYDGTDIRFCGLATDEIYLIRAECYARTGKTNDAMADLNTLMRNRWVGAFTDFTAINAEDALKQVLGERRKELLFRTLRWTDLRRLNKDDRFAKMLSRTYSGITYTLPRNDLRYTMLIPVEVINTSGMPQNPR